MEQFDQENSGRSRKRRGHDGEQTDCESESATSNSDLQQEVTRKSAGNRKRLNIARESNNASQLWEEVRSLIDTVSTQDACILSKCAEC
jgi:hypothetical protein